MTPLLSIVHSDNLPQEFILELTLFNPRQGHDKNEIDSKLRRSTNMRTTGNWIVLFDDHDGSIKLHWPQYTKVSSGRKHVDVEIEGRDAFERTKYPLMLNLLLTRLTSHFNCQLSLKTDEKVPMNVSTFLHPFAYARHSSTKNEPFDTRRLSQNSVMHPIKSPPIYQERDPVE
jgi:hypothetical protein